MHSRIDAAGIDHRHDGGGKSVLGRSGRSDGSSGEKAEKKLVGHQNAVPTLNWKELGVIAFLRQQGLGEIDTKRAERRNPVDPNADRKTRLGAVAEEFLAVARGERQRRIGRSDRAVRAGLTDGQHLRVGCGHARCGRHVETGAGHVEEGRSAQLEQRTHVDEGRRAKAKITRAGTERNLELEPTHVIGPSAERIGDLPVVVDQCAGIFGIAGAADARTDPANIETAQLRGEETVRDADRIKPGARRLLQRLDIASLGPRREDEATTETPIFGALGARADVAHVTAQTREILAEAKSLAAARADPVGVVEHHAVADRAT